MGARNSTPQTVRIDNPKAGVPINITPSVVTRLETEQKRQQDHDQNDQKNFKQNNEKKLEGQEKQPLEPKKQQQEFGQNVENELEGQEEPTTEPKQPKVQEFDHAQEPFESKYAEVEEHQFNTAFGKLEGIVSKPVVWVNADIEKKISRLRKDLIKCYSDNPGETLNCAVIAKNYQDFIFRTQYRSILKLNESGGKSTQSIPPPPYLHSPPYT